MANLCNRMSSRLAWLWNLALTQACVHTHAYAHTYTHAHVWCVICTHTHTQTINVIKCFFFKKYMRPRKSFSGVYFNMTFLTNQHQQQELMTECHWAVLPMRCQGATFTQGISACYLFCICISKFLGILKDSANAFNNQYFLEPPYIRQAPAFH